MIIFPNKIHKGGTIGVTATSGGTEDEHSLKRLEEAIKNLKNYGFKVIETPNVRKCEKLVSSSGEIRAKEFVSLWNNPNVQHIISKSGGEFLMEMLPYLHREKLSLSSPPWIQGFSDTSLLLFYLTTNYNIATVQAENFTTYSMKKWDDSIVDTLKILEQGFPFVEKSFKKYEKYPINREEGKELEPYNLTEPVVYKSLFENKKIVFSGRLIGGCIDVIKTIIGTPYDNVQSFRNQFNEGIIWHLENCELSVPDLYRALWQMKEAKWFNNAKGIIIGRTMSCAPVGEFTYEDVLKNIFEEFEIPVIYDVDFGHQAPMWALVNGSFATFEYENGKGQVTQEAK